MKIHQLIESKMEIQLSQPFFMYVKPSCKIAVLWKYILGFFSVCAELAEVKTRNPVIKIEIIFNFKNRNSSLLSKLSLFVSNTNYFFHVTV